MDDHSRDQQKNRPAQPGRRDALKKSAALAAAAAAAQLGFPALVRAQADPLKLAHLTPRTGFLGQLGDYGFKAASLAGPPMVLPSRSLGVLIGLSCLTTTVKGGVLYSM